MVTPLKEVINSGLAVADQALKIVERLSNPLKVVSATFLLVCFVCLQESTYKKWKNVFYFTSRALFVLEIIKF